jgi:hypothetical protein
MTYRNKIIDRLKKKESTDRIALRVYVSYTTFAMKGLDDMKFEILNSISERFKLDLNHILISGSAQTGESFHKKTNFIAKESDLDIAIVDSDLYQQCLKDVYAVTKDYSDLTGFARKENTSNHPAFLENIGRGFLRPDLMPNSKFKNDWFDFFNKLSRDYRTNFKSINAGVYSSLYFFQKKQERNIQFVKSQELEK